MRTIDYQCSGCGEPKDREELSVKRVQFTTMGEGYKTLKSRTTDWLCPDCLNADPAWNQEMIFSAPGMIDTAPNPKRKR